MLEGEGERVRLAGDLERGFLAGDLERGAFAAAAAFFGMLSLGWRHAAKQPGGYFFC